MQDHSRMVSTAVQLSATDPAVPPALPRDPRSAADCEYDLVVVGGGVHGLCLLLEAVRRGLRAVLLEQNDFGSAVTFNHLRTLHGGLRYLQSLDLPRFFESVAERRWFLQQFPEHTRPLPCLMPLYGDRLRKPAIVRVAALLNDALSLNRNAGVPPSHHLTTTRVVPPDVVQAIFPGARMEGLKGGVVWYDAVTIAPQRLVMELARRAAASGGIALNYVRAAAVLSASGRVAGVRARDEAAGVDLEFRAPTVIVAAGPQGPRWLSAQGLDGAGLFPGRLLLWNVLFDVPKLSDHALALCPRPGGHTYFVHGWEGRVLAGTGEKPVADEVESAAPDGRDLAGFIADLRAAVPSLDLRESQIVRLYHGVLPATRSGALTRRAGIVDHSRRGGPRGLFSVAGIKFTTARRVADRLLSRVFPRRTPIPWERMPTPPTPPDTGYFAFSAADLAPERGAALAALARDEAVVHLADLVLRRTNLGENPARARRMMPVLAAALGFAGDRAAAEIQRVDEELAGALALSSENSMEASGRVRG